jgi:hypothetical protein
MMDEWCPNSRTFPAYIGRPSMIAAQPTQAESIHKKRRPWVRTTAMKTAPLGAVLVGVLFGWVSYAATDIPLSTSRMCPSNAFTRSWLPS